jgi:hypothetical protein
MFMKIKLKKTECRFAGRDIARIEVFIDLVSILDLDGCSIRSLVYVLGDVLECCKGDRGLNIDVAVILC